jgi:hypothetical protein
VKALARLACVLVAGLLGACGGDSSGAAKAAAPKDSQLVLDQVAWDQGTWAD